MREDATEERLIENIPDPKTVRKRLAENLREANLLRRLLKLSVQAHRERDGRREVENFN